MRESWEEYFLGLAEKAAARSTCPRLKVGCVVVKDNHVIATGYNGSKPGEDHCTDVGCDDSTGRCKRTIHAEVNALNRTSFTQRGGSTLYCTHLPCRDCARVISRKGVHEVVYKDDYRVDPETLQTFEAHCIVYRRSLL